MLDPSLSVVAERFARQLAVLTRPSSRLSGEPGIGGCEMADTDELERRDPLRVVELRQLALHPIALGDQLFTDVVLARLAHVS